MSVIDVVDFAITRSVLLSPYVSVTHTNMSLILGVWVQHVPVYNDNKTNYVNLKFTTKVDPSTEFISQYDVSLYAQMFQPCHTVA